MMKPAEVIKHYGDSTLLVAYNLKVSEQTIRNWVTADKVPYIAQLAIQLLTKGKLKANQDE